MHDSETKKNLDARLKRIVGQVSGIQKMVEDDRYCVDILTQISAVRAALNKVSSLLLESHIEHCVKAAFESNDEGIRQEKIDELLRLFEKNTR